MSRDVPHSCNGIEAPRLVVFEVINLKPFKRGSPMEQTTRNLARGEAVRVGVDLAKRVILVHAVDRACYMLTSRSKTRAMR